MVMGEEHFLTFVQTIEVDVVGLLIPALEGFDCKVAGLKFAGTAMKHTLPESTAEGAKSVTVDVERKAFVFHPCSRIVPASFDRSND